jgi:hypothetical protein
MLKRELQRYEVFLIVSKSSRITLTMPQIIRMEPATEAYPESN